MVNVCYAEEAAPPPSFLPTQALQASWVFSGVVTNEAGDNYGYFFQIKRSGLQLHSTAALINGQTNEVLLMDEAEATLTEANNYKWNVGRAFLRFNPINESWVFGLKAVENKGFNFKVDLLKESSNSPPTQDLRPGVALIVTQTSHLNGHIQLGNGREEQFVTAKNAWFRQLWVNAEQAKSHSFTGVLCRFNDGSGFYSAKMVAPDALKGAIAGWSNAEGVSAAISQFITVKEAKNGHWDIRIPSPRKHFILSELINKNQVIAGFAKEGKSPAFCVLNQDLIGKDTA